MSDRIISGFVELGPGVGIGLPPASDAAGDWVPLSAIAIRILVGMTGAGKTTTVAEVTRRHPEQVQVLPDRRVLTDRVILRRYAGEREVVDRLERFDMTRRFRTEVEGGMAAVLAGLYVQQRDGLEERLVLFDGLRGVDEVGHAIRTLPKARFLMLTAPIEVRLQRLLRRSDSFDVANLYHLEAETNLRQHLERASEGHLPARVIDALLGDIETGALAEDAVLSKIAIVVAEATNYDMDATEDLLRREAASRTRHAETDRMPVSEVADLLESA